MCPYRWYVFAILLTFCPQRFKLFRFLLQVMNRHDYVPKMPSQAELELVFDTSFTDIQPYLFKISYATSGPNSPSVGTTVRRLLKDTLAIWNSMYISVEKNEWWQAKKLFFTILSRSSKNLSNSIYFGKWRSFFPTVPFYYSSSVLFSLIVRLIHRALKLSNLL